MRLYSFVNMYLSPIQAGIQTAHALQELNLKYKDTDFEPIIDDWAKNHKTIIVLNGGYQSSIQETINLFDAINDPIVYPDIPKYPIAFFREENDALNNALTCAVVILPECVYNFNTNPMPIINDLKTLTEFKIYDHIKSKRLF